MTREVAGARTFLFVPGDRPDRFGKAAASGADAVILDLEDAVSPDRKDQAREHVHRWLAPCRQAMVRINAAGTPWHVSDVSMVGAHPDAVLATMVPKAQDPAELASLSRTLPAGMAIIPLIETTAGLSPTSVSPRPP